MEYIFDFFLFLKNEYLHASDITSNPALVPFVFIQQHWRDWWIQNILILLLILVLFYAFNKMRKREYWQLAIREIKAKKGAVVCCFILIVYASIALLDSVGFTCPMRNEEGAYRRHETTQIRFYDQGASLLDYILTPLRTHKEKTYSAPLAQYQFVPETVVEPNGIINRVYPELKYPESHLLGTDRVGIDVLYQGIKSIRTGMIIGLITTLLAVPFAILMGVMAGYFGGWVDDIIQYIYTVMSSIPSILFIAAFMLVFGQGLLQLCLAMGIASWTSLCRLLRGETLKLREMEYVQAANSMGVRSFTILLRHIVPNILHLVLISAVIAFSGQVLAEAALTYLGIGVGADTYSWGTMINDARTELTRDPVIWWKLLTSFIFMIGLVLPANIFGDAVRDALDPRLRTQ